MDVATPSTSWGPNLGSCASLPSYTLLKMLMVENIVRQEFPLRFSAIPEFWVSFSVKIRVFSKAL